MNACLTFSILGSLLGSLLGLSACGRLGFNPASDDDDDDDDDAPIRGRVDASMRVDSSGISDAGASAGAILPDAVLGSNAELVCGTSGDAVAFDQLTATCYYRFDSPQTWETAEALCVTLGFGAHLVSIADQHELEFVHQFSNGQIWLGATDEGNEDSFSWVNGRPFGFTYWAAGEPNNDHGGEHCVLAYRGGEWNDARCQLPFRFICRMPLTA